MADYIDREVAVEAMLSRFWDGKETLREIMESISTADVAPVVRARWIGSGEEVYCSNPDCHCHPLKEMDKDTVFYWRYKPPFCPNCGAKMDLEEAE